MARYMYVCAYGLSLKNRPSCAQINAMNQLETYFKALADVNRLRIVNLLLHGELCGCDIQYVLDTPQTNVSRHLTYLKHAGLVKDRRDGYRIFYRLSYGSGPNVAALFEFLRQSFARDNSLQEDTSRLKRAIQAGSCTMNKWRPYSAVSQRAAREAGGPQ